MLLRIVPWQKTYFLVLLAFAALLLFVTAFFYYGLPLPDALRRFRYQFNLTGENSVAAWFSGMLLLLGGVHALDACLRNRQDRLQFLGWGAFAAIMMLLSLDEVGSLHERAGPALVPAGLLLAALTGGSLLLLLRSAVPSVHVFLLGFSFLLFATVAGQEYLQHNSTWWGEMHGLRAGLEEGTELIAMLIIVYVTMKHGTQGESAPFRSVAILRAAAIWAVLALGLGAAAAIHAAGIADGRGNPAIWAASAAFMLNALCFIGRAIEEGAVPSRRLLIILSSIGASVFTVAFAPGFQGGAFEPRMILSHAMFMAASGALAAAYLSRPQSLITEGRWLLGLVAALWLCVPFASAPWTTAAYCFVAACLLRVGGFTPEMLQQDVPADRLARMHGTL